MTDQEQLREMWRRCYELPLKIHTSHGQFVWSRRGSVFCAPTIEQAMGRAHYELKLEGVRPFNEFGPSTGTKRPACNPIVGTR